MTRNTMRFASNLYLTTHRNPKTHQFETDPEGYLFAKGLYRTKIRAKDLPEWYVQGQIHHQTGYISAKGIRHLLYKPSYAMPHLHKDDFLFVSYDQPIEQDQEDVNGIWYHGYDQILYDGMIIPFLKAAKKYSNYDISEIMDEVRKKEDWYRKYYGK